MKLHLEYGHNNSLCGYCRDDNKTTTAIKAVTCRRCLLAIIDSATKSLSTTPVEEPAGFRIAINPLTSEQIYVIDGQTMPEGYRWF